MKIVGIDTGKTIGYALYDIDQKNIVLTESDDIREVKKMLYLDNPEIIIFEKIVSYGMGMDVAVIRAASEIGFFCCVGHDINAKILYYTARSWKNRLCPQPKITQEQRKQGIRHKKITDAIVKNKIINLFNIKNAGYHSSSAAGLIYVYLQEQAKKGDKR